MISVEGAVAGELILHYALNGGTLIVDDALINFEPYRFSFLPAKYCSNEKEMRRSLRILFAHGAPDFVRGERSIAGFAG